MELNLDILEPAERTTLALRALYEKAGYRKYHMSRFEEYSLYQDSRSFLASAQVITFTDLDGRLMALKPDVTLSIAKNARPAKGRAERYYYCENVYRPGSDNRAFEEINQVGVECIGEVNGSVTAQVAGLALESLALVGEKPALALSHMGFVTGALEDAGLPSGCMAAALGAIKSKNARALAELCRGAGVEEKTASALASLITLSGTNAQVAERASGLALGDGARAALNELLAVCGSLKKSGAPGEAVIDFSVVNDINYYNGLVFRGYLEGLPRAALKGGRYDPLADKFNKGAGAVGFALYLNELNRPSGEANGGDKTLRIALPKGRLGDKVSALLASAGYAPGFEDGGSRRLVTENASANIRCFLVKPSDVAAYVEHGAADVGLAGLDVLKESGADVYELLDTRLGRCRMCVAAPRGFKDERSRTLRVATKYPSVARERYASLGRDIDIIKLGGSIELAPLLGLSDVIVDIVETGVTLKANGLEILEEFMDISARLIANKASWMFKREAITALANKLSEAIDDKNT